MALSPCVRNCCLDQHDCCLGCGRLLAEITEWHQANEQRKTEIVEQAAARRAERPVNQFNYLPADPSE